MSTCGRHTDKGSCRVCWQFSFFSCVGASCLTEIIMSRHNTRFSTPVYSMYQMFFLTLCVKLLRHSEQVSAPPLAKGQIQRKKLHCNHPLQIQFFTLLPNQSSHQQQAALPKVMSIHSLLDFNTMYHFRYSKMFLQLYLRSL